MKTYDKLKEKLCSELDEVAKKDVISAGDLEMAHKLTDTIKNIHKIEKLESEMGYSGYDGYSGGRTGTHYVGGHYSRDGGDYSGGRYSRGRYSMDDGRSMFAREMRGVMSNDAYDPMERETMRNAYNNMY